MPRAGSREGATVPARRPYEDCDPETCPCTDGECTLSRYTRASRPSRGDAFPLEDTERAVAHRLEGFDIDIQAMAVVSNLYRAAGSVRNHFERTVLAPHGLTWTGWVVLWVVWIWGETETRHVAAEAGISKATLTGVSTTLVNRGLLLRRTHPGDARRALLSLTPEGASLMQELFPAFNRTETHVTGCLTADERHAVASALRKVVMLLEHGVSAQQRSTR